MFGIEDTTPRRLVRDDRVERRRRRHVLGRAHRRAAPARRTAAPGRRPTATSTQRPRRSARAWRPRPVADATCGQHGRRRRLRRRQACTNPRIRSQQRGREQRGGLDDRCGGRRAIALSRSVLATRLICAGRRSPFWPDRSPRQRSAWMAPAWRRGRFRRRRSGARLVAPAAYAPTATMPTTHARRARPRPRPRRFAAVAPVRPNAPLHATRTRRPRSLRKGPQRPAAPHVSQVMRD